MAQFIDGSVLAPVADMDPIRLAIFFIGLTCLGVIWLASLIVKRMGRKP